MTKYLLFFFFLCAFISRVSAEADPWTIEIYSQHTGRVIHISGDSKLGSTFASDMQMSSTANGVPLEYWAKYKDLLQFKLLYSLSVRSAKVPEKVHVYIFAPLSANGLVIGGEYFSVGEKVSAEANLLDSLSSSRWKDLVHDKKNTKSLDHSGLHTLLGNVMLLMSANPINGEVAERSNVVIQSIFRPNLTEQIEKH